MKKITDNAPEVAIFSEDPELDDKHVLNYTRLLGGCFRDFRSNHPVRGLRTQEHFAIRKLTPYFESTVSRKRVIRAEKIDMTIGFGIIAAYFHEMSVWPAIIDVCNSSKVNDAIYMKLVTHELANQNRAQLSERLDTLHKNFFNHEGRPSK